jgi:hypothetical protein
MAISLALYLAEVWGELTIFLIGGFVLFLYSMARAKRPVALHLFRIPFVRHYFVDATGFSSHIHSMKEMELQGSTVFFKTCENGKYIYDPKEIFTAGKDPSMAHVKGVYPPLHFNGATGSFEVPDGEAMMKAAGEVKAALETKLMIDFNRSIYGKKDLLMMLMFVGIMGLEVIGIVLTYEAYQELSSLDNYFAHYFAGTAPATMIKSLLGI